ncbi:bifunctional 4-hydroxy-2-oxoglutarate aldolase/2-dehydro-3-deoxy-phosphogluconate aldolase [Microvirga sp. W0021]|uniref:2-dehydro-3-deoxy-phosphogluconate aldolase n=1 Tax=Hohaiivirga grylli TaxID=3133970 RepID=A0ABV0BJD6_9HYPH
MKTKVQTIISYAKLGPVIPVVTINDASKAVPLAEALVEGGLPVVEITLRTGAAMEAIRQIAKAVPKAVVAAGTVINAEQVMAVVDAGAKMIVTPGTTHRMAEVLAEAAIPVMPGCSTPSEALELAQLGFEALKFFPASVFGGTSWLKAINGPLPHLTFCPTGGIDLNSAPDYLTLPNVPCVGGTWVAPSKMIDAGDFDGIVKLAKDAVAKLRG